MQGKSPTIVLLLQSMFTVFIVVVMFKYVHMLKHSKLETWQMIGYNSKLLALKELQDTESGVSPEHYQDVVPKQNKKVGDSSESWYASGSPRYNP